MTSDFGNQIALFDVFFSQHTPWSRRNELMKFSAQSEYATECQSWVLLSHKAIYSFRNFGVVVCQKHRRLCSPTQLNIVLIYDSRRRWIVASYEFQFPNSRRCISEQRRQESIVVCDVLDENIKLRKLAFFAICEYWKLPYCMIA